MSIILDGDTGVSTLQNHEKITVDSSGNVGIGTAPAVGVELHVESSDYPYIRTTATGFTGIDFGQNSDTGEGLIKLRDSADLSFWTGDVQRAKFDSNGAFLTPYRPHWVGTQTQSYNSDGSTWGVASGIQGYFKWNSAYSQHGNMLGADNSTFTAPVSGLYHFEMTVDVNNPATFVCQFRKNNARYHDEERVNSQSGWWNFGYSGYVYLSENDTFSVWQNSGTYTGLAGGVWAKMSIIFVG